MALKSWIDEIKTAESGTKSEALLEPASALVESFLPGEKEADEIIFSARDEIVKHGVFYFTAETQAAEVEVNRTYKAILKGGEDLTQLRTDCARWIRTARQKPAPPVMASLFPDQNIKSIPLEKI